MTDPTAPSTEKGLTSAGGLDGATELPTLLAPEPASLVSPHQGTILPLLH